MNSIFYGSNKFQKADIDQIFETLNEHFTVIGNIMIAKDTTAEEKVSIKAESYQCCTVKLPFFNFSSLFQRFLMREFVINFTRKKRDTYVMNSLWVNGKSKYFNPSLVWWGTPGNCSNHGEILSIQGV